MAKELKQDFSGIIAGLVGGGIFIVLFMVLKIGLPISLLGLAGGYIVGKLIFKQSGGSDNDMLEGVIGITQEMLDEAINEGSAKVRKLNEFIRKIPYGEVKKRAKSIAEIAEKIIEDIKKDPKDVKTGRQFLNYYLDSTLKIMDRYVEMSEHKQQSTEVQKVLKKVEDTLETLEAAFAKQLEKLLENDVLDLDTELTVLKRTIDMEGLGKDPFDLGNNKKKDDESQSTSG